jgi:tetratricopeptide (TPR) repeat protein
MSQRDAELAQLLTTLHTMAIERETDKEKRSHARVQFASILTGLKKSEAAEEELREAVEENATAIPMLVATLLREQRADDALELALEGLRREPSPMLAITLIQVMSTATAVPPEADERLLSFLAMTDNAQVLLEASSLRLRQDRRAEATALLERVVEISPDNVVALNNLAALWADEPAKQADALVLANRALLNAPRPLPFIHDTKAKILLHQGKADEALRELEATVQKWPEAEARIYLHLAFAYEQVGRTSDARAALITSRERGLKVRELSPLDRALLTKLDDRLASYESSPMEDNGAQTP